jgi:plastocyanin
MTAMNFRPQSAAQGQRHRPVALFLAVLFSTFSALASAESQSKVHTVDIDAVQFSPATLEVKAGDTVIWKNKDPFPHNVTAENRSFRSGDIQSGQSWKFRAGKKGVFPYVCTLHPNMKAVLSVK